MSIPPYDFTMVQGRGAYTVYLGGELDFAAVLAIGPRIEDVVRRCDSDVRFDLAEVNLIDSEGLKMLLRARATLRDKNLAARVVNPSPCASRVIKLAGIADLLGYVDASRQATQRQLHALTPGP